MHRGRHWDPGACHLFMCTKSHPDGAWGHKMYIAPFHRRQRNGPSEAGYTAIPGKTNTDLKPRTICDRYKVKLCCIAALTADNHFSCAAAGSDICRRSLRNLGHLFSGNRIGDIYGMV